MLNVQVPFYFIWESPDVSRIISISYKDTTSGRPERRLKNVHSNNMEYNRTLFWKNAGLHPVIWGGDCRHPRGTIRFIFVIWERGKHILQ